jgi:hypothetical protein
LCVARVAITLVRMRIVPSILVVFALASEARADSSIAGSYDVQFEEAASTCTQKPETLSKGTVVIAVKKGSLTVKFDTIYQMVGAPPKDGKISAKTKNLIGTSVGGLSARYSVTGRVDNAALELVLTALYIRQDTNKPHCQQVWNVKGTRR